MMWKVQKLGRCMIMFGQTKSYNLKSQKYWDLPEPIALKEIGIKVDYPALIQFAKDSGKKFSN